MLISNTLGGAEIAWRHNFDLYDVQDKKKQWNDSPVTRSIFLSIFYGSKISSERLERAANEESVLEVFKDADKQFWKSLVRQLKESFQEVVNSNVQNDSVHQ